MRQEGRQAKIIKVVARAATILLLSFTFNPAGVFAQELYLSPREQMMVATLNQAREKDSSLRDVVLEMQLVQAQEALARKQAKPKRVFPKFITKVHPYFGSSTFYTDKNSNIGDKHSVLGFSNTPGVKINFLGKDKFMNIDLAFTDFREAQRSVGNADSASFNFFSSFILNKYTLTFADNYFTNYVAGTDLGIDEKEYNYFWRNTFSTSLSGRFNRFGFGLGYDRTDTNYKRNVDVVEDSENAVEPGGFPGGAGHSYDSFSLTSYLKLAPKTTASMEWRHNRTNYLQQTQDNIDTYANSYSLGLSNILSHKLTGSSSLSYSTNHYPGNYGIPKSIGFSSALSYIVSERSDLQFSFGYSHHNEPESAGNYDSTSLALSGNHRLIFNPRLRISFDCGITRTVYPKTVFPADITKTRNIGLGLAYAFRQWLDFSLGYDYTRYDYNYDLDDYGTHTVRLSTQARF